MGGLYYITHGAIATIHFTGEIMGNLISTPLLVLFTCSLISVSATAEAWTVQGSDVRAQPQDTVWVITTHIKADKQDQFEQFMDEFRALGNQTVVDDPDFAPAYESTRILYPAGANEDGTFTYFMVIDPIITGFAFSINDILERYLPEPEAKLLHSTFTESLASPQHQWVTLQSELGLLKAANDDTVWIVRYPVYEDKKEQFEQFTEAIWDMGMDAEVLSSNIREAIYRTRVLYPTQADEDGYYSYFFVMDPHITGIDYSIQNMLQHFYPHDQVDLQYQLFEESIAGPLEEWTVVQQDGKVQVEVVMEE